MIQIIFGIVLLGLLIGTITDFRTREVPDFVNYSLITLGFAINLILTLYYGTYSYIINSIAGFIAFLIIALIMFYAGQWGGGDSKMLMALGALLGLDITFNNLFLLHFFFNILIVGGIWGLIWAFVLAVRHKKKFIKEYRKLFKNELIANATKMINFILPLIIIMTLLFIKTPLKVGIAGLFVLILVLFHLTLFIKAIEKSSMINLVTPDKLTEGDWIVKDIKYKGKVITGPKDLGIEKAQINQLKKLYKQKKIKKILIKEGIPFVPSFFIAFILTITLGNLLFLFL